MVVYLGGESNERGETGQERPILAKNCALKMVKPVSVLASDRPPMRSEGTLPNRYCTRRKLSGFMM